MLGHFIQHAQIKVCDDDLVAKSMERSGQTATYASATARDQNCVGCKSHKKPLSLRVGRRQTLRDFVEWFFEVACSAVEGGINLGGVEQVVSGFHNALNFCAAISPYLDCAEFAFPILPNLCLILPETRFLCIQGLRAVG
jgi:hypothetical protein